MKPQTLEPTPTGRRRWTREEFEFIERAGLLNGRYELLDGEIIEKMGQNRPHALTLSLVVAWVYRQFDARRIQTQATMEVRVEDRVTNRPEPDVVVYRDAPDGTASGSDAVLLVEVCDSTAAEDFGIKVPLYARVGVQEYWIVDIPRRLVAVHRNPNTETGEWTWTAQFRDGDTLTCLAAPSATVAVTDLLP